MATSRDVDTILSISSINDLVTRHPNALPMFQQLYEAAGPEMPDGLQSTPVKTDIQGLPAFHFNYDEGHAGQFTVPSTEGASVSFEWVLRRPKPSKYIMEHLTFYLSDIERHMPLSESGAGNDENDAGVMNDVGGRGTAHSEVTVFIPGLNTLHEPAEGETSTPQRLASYVRTLNVPMSQVHIGTSFDQGDFTMNVTDDALATAITADVVPSTLRPSRVPGTERALIWTARQIDAVQAALSTSNVIDTPVKLAVRGLLDSALTSGENVRPVTLVGYSRGAIELRAALHQFIDRKVTADGEDLDVLQRKLRQRVTVVTIGAVHESANTFPKGPAYIHIAAANDPVPEIAAAGGANTDPGHDDDTVYLSCESPYNEASFDSHNFGALTSQFLAVVLEFNGLDSFRALWEKGVAGNLVVPQDEGRLTRAVIQLTRGYTWLWNEEGAWKDIPFGALPTDEEASKLLKERIGDSFVDRLVQTFGLSEL